jgi:hypothetical protein
LLWEKSTAGWLLVAGLFWEKSTAGWWLISRTNSRLCNAPVPAHLTSAIQKKNPTITEPMGADGLTAAGCTWAGGR